MTRATQALEWVVLLLPLLLIHARGVAEGVFGLLALGIVLRCAWQRDFSPFRQPWVLAGLGYWFWLVLCTVLVGAGREQLLAALAWGRMPLAILALSHWVLVPAVMQRRLLWSGGIAVCWVVLEVWLQLLFGRGITGQRRWPAGELPGPFTRPRAGPFLAMAAWPPLVAALGWLLANKRQLLAYALLAFALVTQVIIGQRFPIVLAVFAAVITAALLPGLALGLGLAAGAGALAVAAASFVAPMAFWRMTVLFPQQVLHFGDSHYGKLWARGLEMLQQHPVTGLGARAFGEACTNPAYFVGWGGQGDGGGAAICVTHAHNPYLEAATDAGIPGLLLFALMSLLVVLAAARGLRRGAEPARIGLFIATLLPVWPIASANGFTALPIAGVWMLSAGLALAMAPKHQG